MSPSPTPAPEYASERDGSSSRCAWLTQFREGVDAARALLAGSGGGK